jgi:mono/diheme cytochrome c family protein
VKFLLGIVSGVLLVALGAAAVVYTGSFNTAATVPPGRLEKRIATFALDRAVAKRAPDRKNPLPPGPETLREGLREYRSHCLVCHGAPGVDPGPIGQGLNPGAPDLSLPRVQARTDGQLFWITSEGIRMTGMPAFGPTEDEEEIWHMVAFVRHLPELTDDEMAQLRERARFPTPAGPAPMPTPATP